MRVRPLEAKDIDRLTQIHEEMGSTYPLPDLTSPQFEQVSVLVDENDVPVMAIAARKTVETYLLMDGNWRTPKWRLTSFAMLHDRVIEKLKGAGYTDVHAWIMPELVEKFGMRRLVRQFGWVRSAWQSFFKEFGE